MGHDEIHLTAKEDSNADKEGAKHQFTTVIEPGKVCEHPQADCAI